MQSITNIGSDNDTNLVTAQALREMTITKESLAKRQKDSLMDSFMSSMVKQATEAGNTSYAVNLRPDFDATMLNEITTELRNLGYTVDVKTTSNTTVGEYLVLTVNW